jgi:hypothetical protein
MFRPLRRGEVIFSDDIADPDPATRHEHAVHLVDDLALVGGQVDDTVADNHIHRTVRERYLLDDPLQELDIGRARLGGVAACQFQHLVGHVDPVGEASRPNPSRREQHVDAPARAQVKHPFTFPKFCYGGGIAAAQAGRYRGHRQLVALAAAVEPTAECLVNVEPGWAAA